MEPERGSVDDVARRHLVLVRFGDGGPLAKLAGYLAKMEQALAMLLALLDLLQELGPRS